MIYCIRTVWRPLFGVAVMMLLVFGGMAGRLWGLEAAAMQSMVIVEGDSGNGSGFAVKMGGRIYLVTNSHVVRGNENLKFRNLRNVTIVGGPLQIADQVDAVRTEITKIGSALELEPGIDKLKIGDEVIVAGNSEGEGVIREIPGKVIGIGPDRIEVDAEFVPGNSGSPILLKSTGKVIGIATYMKIPRGSGKSPLRLNEVRRFGYRLDTVAKWVTPATKDRLFMEGLKLSEMERLMSSVTTVLDANAGFVSKMGANGFVSKEKAQQFPAFAALSQGIEDFSKNHLAAKTDEDRKKNAAGFFEKVRSILADDVRGLNENQFTGFYSVQLKDSLARVREFSDWCEGTTLPAFRDFWLTTQSNSRLAMARKSDAPPIDPSTLKLTLSDHVSPNEPPDYCHHVTYPLESQPANLENLFWVIEDPQRRFMSYEVHTLGVHVRTPSPGIYHVHIEFRGMEKPYVVSNTAEINVTGEAPAPGGNGGAAPANVSATIVGTWTFSFSKTQWSASRTLKADGTFMSSDAKGTGSWQVVGEKVVLTYPSGAKDEMFLPLDPKGSKVVGKRGREYVAVKEAP